MSDMADGTVTIRLIGPHSVGRYTVDTIRGAVTLTSDSYDKIRRGDVITELIAERLSRQRAYEVTIVAHKR
jgi:hypothetical protein